MQSNGYGRHEQTIIIRVDSNCVKQASAKLKSSSFRVSASGHHDFIYKRLTTTLGDDESIVYDVDAMLGLKSGTWSIVWDECEY